MRNKIAITKNIMTYILKMSATKEELLESGEGMAVLRGDAGVGKTLGTTYVAVKTSGVFVRAQRVWKEASMLSKILVELGVKKEHQSMFIQWKQDLVIEMLKKRHRPLFIDEADYLSMSMLDILRDIHDEAKVPVVIICMEDMQQGLLRNPRFARRITHDIELQPMDTEDARNVMQTVFEAKIADDLFEHLFTLSAGNVGLFTNGLRKVERMISRNGWDSDTPVTKKQWGDRTLIIGGGNAR